MDSNTIIVVSLITLFFLLYLLVRKKLSTLVKCIYLFTIFAMIAISFLLINRNDFPAMVYAKEVATQNTRKALLSIKEETNLLKESVLLDAPIVNQLPEHVLNRKKLGFPVPIRHWLKDEMNEWAKNIIKESDTDHLLNKSVVLQLLEDHCQGKADNSRKIWTVLMFMVWHSIYIEKKYSFEKEYLKEGKVAIKN